MDKTATRSSVEITLNPETMLPEKMKLLVLTGVKGTVGSKRLVDEEHVAFQYEYKFSSFNEVKRFPLPKEATKLLR